MHKTLSALACAAALCLGTTAAQANVVTFDAPGLIDIDGNGNATYSEAGFTLSGVAATFLPIDGVGSGGSGGLFVAANSLLTLMAAGGGLFSLVGLDAGLYDPQDTTPSPSLVLQGLLADNTMLSQTLGLGGLASFGFANWVGLKEVSFTANTDFVLDNISVVPEPATWVLVGVALLGLGLGQRRAGRLTRAEAVAA